MEIIGQEQVAAFLKAATQNQRWLRHKYSSIRPNSTSSESDKQAICGALVELESLIGITKVLCTQRPQDTMLSRSDATKPMVRTIPPRHQPSCMLAHKIINQASIIVGCCELLEERIPQADWSSKKFQMIRNATTSMIEELAKHQCGRVG